MNGPLLAVEGLSKTFGGQRGVEALKDLSIHVDAGEFVAIVGPSGSGKTTLFNLISGLEEPSAGRIEVKGFADPDARRRRCAYLFQKDLLFPWRSLLDNAALGLEVSGGVNRAQARKRASALLDRFGLSGFESYRPRELSGGMRQRVALLRTLLLERPLLLLDEPFASLDAITRRELQQWLRQTWREGSEAALLVTHDVREAVYVSDRVYVMSERPGTITAEISIDLSEQDRADPITLAHYESKVLTVLDFGSSLPQAALAP